MRFYRFAGLLAVCTGLIWAGFAVCPIRNTGIKLILLCTGVGFGVSLILLLRSRATRLIIAALFLVPVILVAVGPLRPINRVQLGTDYVRALQSYREVAYVWGGENRRGVDCSGLVRAAWIDAHLRRGLRDLNPGLLREAAVLWWLDSSALELGRGYGGRTRPILEAPNVRVINATNLLAGDLAVLARGVHVMAYLGDNEWIEADPGVHRVIKLPVTDRNPWLDSRAVVVRWTSLNP